MSRVDGFLASVIVLIGLLLAGYLSALQYGAAERAAGYADAVEDGREQQRRSDEAARRIENDLRARLRERDAYELKKEHEHAESLAAAQRRIRAGADSLRCPAGPVPASVAADDRPVAGGSAPDGPGPAIVPEAAADLVGVAGHIAGLVQRYARLEQRFDECQALNARP